MSININIQLPKEHIPHLKEYYKNRLTQLEHEMTEIYDILNRLDGQESVSPPLVNGNNQGFLIQQATALPNGYHPKWPLIKKAKFAIKQAGRTLTSKDIVDFIIDKFEPSLLPERKKFMSSMSGVLSANSTKENPIFKRHQNELEEWEYDVA